MSTWHGVMADGEEFMRWKISTNTVDRYKTVTKCAHSVHGRPTLKDEERFWNGLVRKPYERSLYEQTFMSEPFIEKHAISTELCNVNREKDKLKSHRVCRRDREPSRIPIRSLKSPRNKSRMKVKSDHHSEFSNLSNWKEEAWKNQGFNRIRTRDPRDTGAMLYQLSYEATHWERGQFIEFISPLRSEMMWSIYMK